MPAGLKGELKIADFGWSVVSCQIYEVDTADAAASMLQATGDRRSAAHSTTCLLK